MKKIASNKNYKLIKEADGMKGMYAHEEILAALKAQDAILAELGRKITDIHRSMIEKGSASSLGAE